MSTKKSANDRSMASQFASQLPKVCDEVVQCTVGTDVNLQPTFSCPHNSRKRSLPTSKLPPCFSRFPVCATTLVCLCWCFGWCCSCWQMNDLTMQHAQLAFNHVLTCEYLPSCIGFCCWVHLAAGIRRAWLNLKSTKVTWRKTLQEAKQSLCAVVLFDARILPGHVHER